MWKFQFCSYSFFFVTNNSKTVRSMQIFYISDNRSKSAIGYPPFLVCVSYDQLATAPKSPNTVSFRYSWFLVGLSHNNKYICIHCCTNDLSAHVLQDKLAGNYKSTRTIRAMVRPEIGSYILATTRAGQEASLQQRSITIPWHHTVHWHLTRKMM